MDLDKIESGKGEGDSKREEGKQEQMEGGRKVEEKEKLESLIEWP